MKLLRAHPVPHWLLRNSPAESSGSQQCVMRLPEHLTVSCMIRSDITNMSSCQYTICVACAVQQAARLKRCEYVDGHLAGGAQQ